MPMMPIKPIPSDLAAELAPVILRAAVPTDSGCLIRTVQLNKTGYALIMTRGSAATRKSLLAHRVVYTHLRGPIPDGMTIDHLCRTRNCVNVDHLEVVTSGENTLRGNSVSGIRARMTRCANGHPFTVEASGRRRCRTCRRAYDLLRNAAKRKAAI